MPKIIRDEKYNQVNVLIGKRIYEARRKRGWFRSRITKKLRVTQQQLFKYERGLCDITVVRLVIIASLLELDLAYFLKDVEDMFLSKSVV